MFRKVLPDVQVIAAVLTVLLSAMLFLTSQSSAPLVSVGQVRLFDDGSAIVLIGVVVEMVPHDAGAESLILADPADGATVRVYCDQGLRELPSHYLSIGDEARIEGEVSGTGASPMLFATSDGVSVSRRAGEVLSLEILSRNWALFEGDSFSIGGLVIAGDLPDDFKLTDSDMRYSISLRSGSVEFASFVGKWATLEAVLRLDPGTMVLVLIASSLSPGKPQQAFSSGLTIVLPCLALS